jgi:DNA polymerase III delta subunit
MLHLFSGTDREKARAELNVEIKKVLNKGTEIVRITDAHAVADLRSALQGAGMFGGERIIVLEGVWGNEEMRTIAGNSLESMRDSQEQYFILEEKLDAAARKLIEKYAEDSKRFDAKKMEETKTIFALANALQSRDRKALWVGYQRELLTSDPEAIQGVLFWAAKQMLLSARNDTDRARAEKIIATLTELPHQARRRGVDLEYALEKFVLSGA